MQKIRIAEKGWDHFNDYLGSIKFTNGVSDRPLTEREIQIVGSSLKITPVDSDEQLGPATEMILKREDKAPKLEPLKVAKEEKIEEVKVEAEKIAETTDDLLEQNEAPKTKWTKDDLEILASEKGIQGIREEAAKFGIKGVQIAKLIEQILEAQEKEVE